MTAITSLYVESRSRVKTLAGTSRDFGLRVGVHQGSALSLLLFITVMEEATKLARGDGLWELLYANDLELTAESREEVTDMFNRWKEGMEQRGLKINMEKTKLMMTRNEARERILSGKWLCGCCGRGVEANSVLCTRCNKWCHQRCSGLRNLRGGAELCMPKMCVGGGWWWQW